MTEVRDDSALPENIRDARSLPGAEPWRAPYSNLAALLAARADSGGEREFLRYFDDGNEIRRSWSRAEFARAVEQAAGFLETAGVTRGDRVAFLIGNLDYTMVLYFATWALGASVAPINATEDLERKAFILENSGAALLFCRSGYLDEARRLVAGTSVRLVEVRERDEQPASSDLESYPGVEADARPRPLASSEFNGRGVEALLIYTSGTTGAPKGVRVDQHNMMADAHSMIAWHGWDEELCTMCVLPIHHVNGIIVTHITPLFAGGRTVLNTGFKSDAFWPRVAECGVHVVSVVPTLLEFLISAGADGTQSEDVAAARETLQTIVCGAGPLLVETALSFERTFGVPITHGYGLSETTCYNCHLPPALSTTERERWLRDFGFPSIGVALPLQRMAILRPDGTEAAEQERGEIAIRGEAVSLGYDNRPEANESAFHDGWFLSGDEGFWVDDERGRFFFITGRMKELIIRGGVNYAPLEIDEALCTHAGVQYGLAVPFANRFYGEEIAAYVVPSPGAQLDAGEVLAHCVAELGFSKSPKVLLLGDEVPYTSTGKPRRIALGRQLAEALAPFRGVQFRKGDDREPVLLDLRG